LQHVELSGAADHVSERLGQLQGAIRWTAAPGYGADDLLG